LTKLTLEFNTPAELRLGSGFLIALAEHREATPYWNQDMPLPGFDSGGKGSCCGSDEPRALPDRADAPGPSGEPSTGAPAAIEPAKRKRRTKAEIEADNARAAAPGASDAAGKDDEAAKLLDAYDSLSGRAGDSLSGYGEKRETYEFAEKTAPPAAPLPVQFTVTRRDGKTASFTHSHMAVDCLVAIMRKTDSSEDLDDLMERNTALVQQLTKEQSAPLMAAHKELCTAAEAVFADDSAEDAKYVEDAKDVPTDPEQLKNELRDMLVAYIKRPDVGFVKGTAFLVEHAKADRFTKIDVALYPHLYRLVKPLVA
jgi:hypothetical protein